MRVEHDLKMTFDDVLIRPKRSTLVSRSDVTLSRDFKFRHSDETWSGVPIVAANMDCTGLFPVAKELQKHGMLTCLQKFYSTRECARAWEDGVDPSFVAVTCGSTDESFELLRRKMATNDGIKMICIDVANGYREVFLDFVKRVRDEFPSKIVIAGNVATREMTEALILAGADIVKVGIGPGSVCTTRRPGSFWRATTCSRASRPTSRGWRRHRIRWRRTSTPSTASPRSRTSARCFRPTATPSRVSGPAPRRSSATTMNVSKN